MTTPRPKVMSLASAIVVLAALGLETPPSLRLQPEAPPPLPPLPPPTERAVLAGRMAGKTALREQTSALPSGFPGLNWDGPPLTGDHAVEAMAKLARGCPDRCGDDCPHHGPMRRKLRRRAERARRAGGGQ